MDHSVMQYEVKINEILNCLLRINCGCNINDDLDKVLTHLESEQSSLISRPLFTKWIRTAVAVWCSKKVAPPIDVVCFSLNLAKLLSKHEQIFCVLNNNNFFIKLINILKARQPTAPARVKLAYIALLTSFLEHKSGIEWMMVCTFWEDVFHMSLSEQSYEVTELSYRFVAKILERTADHDEMFPKNLVKRIVECLGESLYADKLNDALSCLLEPTKEQKLQSSKLCLKLTGNVLEHFLNKILYSRNDVRVPLMFLKMFHADNRFSDFFMNSQETCFDFDVARITFVVQFTELYAKVITKNLTTATKKTSIQRIINHFMLTLSKATFEDIQKLCNFGHLYWRLMTYTIAAGNEEITIFATEVTTLQLLPSICFMIKYCYAMSQIDDLLDDEFRYLFVQKVANKMKFKELYRLFYFWRDGLVAAPNLFDLCVNGINSIKNSRKYFLKEQAVRVCQLLYYNLKDTVDVVKESPQKIQNFRDGLGYFSLIFDVLAVFINEFEITWRDSVETIDLMAISLNFLTLFSWPKNIVVKAMHLINVCLEKYMTPNLALLIDRTSDSAVAVLGPFLFGKLHDDLSDVRKAALDITCSISRISRKEFPSLQKMLLDSELPPIIVEMSTYDDDSCVRTAAIKCLQELIQVEELWRRFLEKQCLFQKMKDILSNDADAAVRAEAATFMGVMYDQKFCDDNLHHLYEIMFNSATADRNWEVRARALDFWSKVIEQHLYNEGMIDGSFPEVTFSKEKRKIVTLTDVEIRKRLQQVLERLSAAGCLGVLVSAMKNDRDATVSQTALKITNSLTELAEKYNLCSEGDESFNMNSLASYFSSFSDEIIEETVTLNETRCSDNVVKKVIPPDEFLQFVKQDLVSVISRKKNIFRGSEDLMFTLDNMLLKLYGALSTADNTETT